MHEINNRSEVFEAIFMDRPIPRLAISKEGLTWCFVEAPPLCFAGGTSGPNASLQDMLHRQVRTSFLGRQSAFLRVLPITASFWL